MSSLYSYDSRFTNSAPLIGVLASCALTPINVGLHECGHALSMKILLDNTQIKIQLYAFGFHGAVCNRGPNATLSSFGQFIGLQKTVAIIASAGPITEIVKSLALRYFFPNARIIAGYRMYSDLLLAKYALSTFQHWFKNPTDASVSGHDFLHVRNYGGILPALTLVTCCFGLGILSACDYIKASKSQT